MKTFKQFQEAAISVPAIVGASKYIIPALMTGIGAAGTIKGGSKLLPKLMTGIGAAGTIMQSKNCLLYTSPSPRDLRESRMPSSA